MGEQWEIGRKLPEAVAFRSEEKRSFLSFSCSYFTLLFHNNLKQLDGRRLGNGGNHRYYQHPTQHIAPSLQSEAQFLLLVPIFALLSGHKVLWDFGLQ